MADDGARAAIAAAPTGALPAAPSCNARRSADHVHRDVANDATSLVAAAQAGDRRALETFLSGVRPLVYRYVLARLVDRGLADDVTQEVLMTIVAALPRYTDTGRSPLAWVFGIAANKVSECRRAAVRRAETSIDVFPDRPSAALAEQPEQVAERLESAREMAQLLDGLPHPQGEIIRLRVAAGLTAEQTAAVLGMTAGSVRVAQHRALTRLRATMCRAEG